MHADCLMPQAVGDAGSAIAAPLILQMDSMQSVAPQKICVGAITRQREKTFSMLLASFSGMRRPEQVELLFAFVENDQQQRLSAVVDAFRETNRPAQVIHENEPRLGIPYARNRVLDIALRHNCDALIFVDDDETVDPDWLPELVRVYREQSLDLVGGPVRLHPCPEQASYFERLVWDGLRQRFKRLEVKAAMLAQIGRGSQVTVVTSNWLADLGFLRRCGLRFDESIGLSGGSDTRFFHQARSLGARTGWAPRALVLEYMSRNRLTLRYQFKRGRDQAISTFWNKHRNAPAKAVARAVAYIPYKALMAVLLAALGPVTLGRSFVAAVRSLGFATGYFLSLRGMRSRHYEAIN